MTSEASTEDARPQTWREERDMLGQLVFGRIMCIQEGYCREDRTAESKSALAKLRQALSSNEAGAVSAHTFVPITKYRLTSSGEEPRLPDSRMTEAENAVHAAMTLYAVHQQSLYERMHGSKAARPGSAFALLVAEGMSEQALRRRFDSMLTATNYPALLMHLRTLVRLLRDRGIPMDYGQFTRDLYEWQFDFANTGIRVSWSRDFENTLFQSSKEAKENQE